MADRILTSREGRVLTITNNDPETRNSLSPEFYVGLRETLEEVQDDTSIRAVVLTGAGGFFCSGGNINSLAERKNSDYGTVRAGVEYLHGMIRAMRNSSKPIIAAVEGGAAGAGAALALACDMIVAANNSYLSIAYIRIGVTPDGGSTALLSKMVPPQMLAEMVFTGDRIPVERLHTVGVVNRLSSPGSAMTDAQALAVQLADGPPKAMSNAKRLLELSRSSEFETQLNAEAEGIARALLGDEAAEGTSAFLEKRAPKW
ncbi:MAG: oxepin-CoA hydrolase, alternative type [Hyphomicrobiaceae bacterium]